MIDELEAWRIERGLDKVAFVADVQLSFIFEELSEYLRANTENDKVDALCDIAVFGINALALFSYEIPELDIDIKGDWRTITRKALMVKGNNFNSWVALVDIVRLAFRSLHDMGYNHELCMNETIKEISSRTGEYNEETGKFEKYTTPEAKALWYKADYESCKL